MGKSAFGQTKIPPDFTRKGFKGSLTEGFVVRDLVKEKLRDLVESGDYGTSIESKEELQQAGIVDEKYDFVSCNNVLQYVKEKNLQTVIERLLNLVKDGGVVVIKTEKQTIVGKIKSYMGSVHLNDFKRLGKGRYKKQ